MNRRHFLLAGLAAGSLSACATSETQAPPPAAVANTDGTPLQFIPKKPKDPSPLDNELAKYPKCPYCGMDRREYHFSRHLIHYSDDLVDGTCSLHCAAISLSLNLDRVPKAIYAADFGAAGDIKPLTNAEAATYLVGGKLRPVMSKTAKTAFASPAAAKAEMAKSGGDLAGFDKALMLSYQGMAEDTALIRQRREERRRKAAEKAAAS